MHFNTLLESPTVEEFCALRQQVGWGIIPHDLGQYALNNSLFHVTVRQDDTLIGMGRVIGDGALFFYIQDVLVKPDWQKQGVGHILMQAIEGFLAQTAKEGSTIGLFAAQGKENFYKKYQYLCRTGTVLGQGMCKFI